jgi:hypothetical protein
LPFEQFNVTFYRFLTPSFQPFTPWISLYMALKSPWILLFFMTCGCTIIPIFYRHKFDSIINICLLANVPRKISWTSLKISLTCFSWQVLLARICMYEIFKFLYISCFTRHLDGLSDIEARFELASLSLNITKPQLVLLQDIHQSWSNSILRLQGSLSGSSLIQDVFHPSGLEKIFCDLI